jgi:homogentisate solanesyltransferase
MGKRLAWAVVLTSAVCGPLIVAALFSRAVLGLYCFGLLIGALYSVPPFQTKRNPFLAGLTIACVRGFLLNFGVYYAVKEALGIPFAWNRAVIFLARFMTVFAGVIAVTK